MRDYPDTIVFTLQVLYKIYNTSGCSDISVLSVSITNTTTKQHNNILKIKSNFTLSSTDLIYTRSDVKQTEYCKDFQTLCPNKINEK